MRKASVKAKENAPLAEKLNILFHTEKNRAESQYCAHQHQTLWSNLIWFAACVSMETALITLIKRQPA